MRSPRPPFLRTAAGTLALAICLTGGALVACDDDGDQQAQAVCVDPVSALRVDDYQCSGASDFTWWYFLYGHPYPAVGSYVTRTYIHDYRTSAPRSYVRGGAAPSGGKVSSTSLAKGTPAHASATPRSSSTSKPTPRPTTKPSAPARREPGDRVLRETS